MSSFPGFPDAARDAGWLERLRHHDERALDALLRTYSVPLTQYVYRMVGSADLAQDIVQDVWIWLWEHRDTVRVAGSVRSYLFRAAHNRALNALREGHTRVRYAQDAQHALESTRHAENSGESTAQSESFQAAVAALVRDMRPPTREIVWLRFGHGLSATEVADVLQMPVGNVQKALSRHVERVLQRLRKLVT